MSRKVIDLTYPIEEGMTTFPVYWHPRVQIKVLGRLATEGRETRQLTVGTHTGTHCDAPHHFIGKGKSVDRLPVDIFMGAALVLDFSWKKKKEAVTVEDLKNVIGNQKVKRVLLRFDWSDHWRKRDFYRSHPYLTEDAALWLVKKGVLLVGMDTPMPDNPVNGRGSEKDSPNHKIFLGNNVILLEYLCNLKRLTKKKVEMVALPLKIKKGDGSPVRCVAWVK